MAVTERAPRTRALVPSDLFAVDDLLGDDERLIRDTVRAFVRERALPVIPEHFEAGTFPRELIPEVAELGLLGMHLHGYGCAGTSAIAYGVASEELEAGDSGLRSFVSVQGSLAMFPIWAYGSEEQKSRWLPEMAAGRAIGCFGLTEPDAGSDPVVDAHRRRGATAMTGSSTAPRCGSPTARWPTSRSCGRRPTRGVRGFLVERGMRGFTTSDVHNKLSLRASVTSELSFDSVRLPDSAVLPGVTGMRGPLSCLNEARFGIGWGAMGAARACFESALEYSKTRRAFGKPIGAMQLTQQKLANMATSIVQGRLLAHRLGTLKDQGRLHPVQVSITKRANVRAALDIARSARTILGANGITLEYPVSRHMANLESVLTYEGTEEVHTLIIGKELTGENAFG